MLRTNIQKIATLGGFLGLLLILPGNAQAEDVMIIEILNGPGAKIERLPAKVKISQATDCISAEEMKRYFNENTAGYNAEQNKIASCKIGLMTGTILDQQITDIKKSLAEINERIAALTKTSVYLNQRKDLNDITLIGIPSGIMAPEQYEYAKAVQMRCIQFPENGANNKRVEAIGSLAKDEIPLFDSEPEKQLKILRDFERSNREIDSKLKAEIAKNNKISTATVIAVAKKVASMRSELSASSISILPEDSQKFAAARTPGKNSSLSITYNLDKDGKKQFHKLSWMIDKILSAVTTGLDEQFVDANIILGDITYSEVWIPEQFMLKNMRDDTDKHIVRLKKLASEYGNMLNKLEPKLAELKNKNYNCN